MATNACSVCCFTSETSHFHLFPQSCWTSRLGSEQWRGHLCWLELYILNFVETIPSTAFFIPETSENKWNFKGLPPPPISFSRGWGSFLPFWDFRAARALNCLFSRRSFWFICSKVQLLQQSLSRCWWSPTFGNFPMRSANRCSNLDPFGVNWCNHIHLIHDSIWFNQIDQSYALLAGQSVCDIR